MIQKKFKRVRQVFCVAYVHAKILAEVLQKSIFLILTESSFFEKKR